MLPKYYHEYSIKDVMYAFKGLFNNYERDTIILLRKRFNYKHIILLDSGRACLDLTLKHLNLPKKTKVAIPVNACEVVIDRILDNELIPVFIDIDQDLTISLKDLEKKLKLNKDIKAVIPIYSYGNQYNIVEINKLSKKYHFKIIEDKAQTFSNYKNNEACCSFISLDIAKYISSIKGGIIMTDNHELYRFIKKNKKKSKIGIMNIIEFLGFITLTNEIIYTLITSRIKNILKSKLFYLPKNQNLSKVNIAIAYSQIKKLNKIQKNRYNAIKNIEYMVENLDQNIITINNNKKDNLFFMIRDEQKSTLLKEVRKYIDLPEKVPLLSTIKKYKKYSKSKYEFCKVYDEIVLLPMYRKAYKKLKIILKSI